MKEKGKKLLWIGSICIAVFLIWTLRIFRLGNNRNPGKRKINVVSL